MENSKISTDPDERPKAVSKIVIKKGAGTPGDSVTVTLDFTDAQIPFSLNPTPVLFCDWQLTPAGGNAHYNPQQNFNLGMVGLETETPNHYVFEGNKVFNFDKGSGNGIMYCAKIEVPGNEPTAFIDVCIE